MDVVVIILLSCVLVLGVVLLVLLMKKKSNSNANSQDLSDVKAQINNVDKLVEKTDDGIYKAKSKLSFFGRLMQRFRKSKDDKQ